MFKLTATLLEYFEGEFQGNAYATVKLRSPEVANGAILKYKLDAKRVPNCSEFLDKKVEVDVDVQRGQNDSASLRVVSVRPVAK